MKIFRSYWQLSRAPRYSVLLAVPLLLLYEALAAALSDGEGGVRNGADVLLKSAFAALAGEWGPVVFGAALLGGCLWLVGRDLRRQGGVRRGLAGLRPHVFAGMLAESALLALLFGGVVALVTAELLRPFALVGAAGAASPAAVTLAVQGPLEALSWPARLMVSLGAGLYEELLFRVVLVGGLAVAGRHLLGLGPRASAVVAVLLGALLFSASHYVGAYGDAFTLASFTFRFVAGVFFSGLFLLRGFGITAWTHALYDVFLLVV